MTRKDDTHHHLSQVWGEVHRHGEAIASLQAGQEAIESKLESIGITMTDIAHSINRPKPPINWIAIGALCVSVLIAGGAYTKSVMYPIEKETYRLDLNQSEFLKTLPKLYMDMGMNNQRGVQSELRLGGMEARVDDLASNSRANTEHIEALKTWINDVDKLGSRRWVEDSK